MPVATFSQPNYTTDTDSTVYKNKLDVSVAANQQLAGLYAAHESAAPNMTVTIAPGRHMYNGALVVQAQQISAAITAPVSNPRIDRFVINEITGALFYVAGAEAASPAAPAIPAGYFPCCQVLLDNSPATTAITNTLITDERSAVTLPIIDEDSMVTNSAFLAPSQQSAKAYMDSKYTILDTPEVLVSNSATNGSWQPVSSATLAAASAKAAVLRFVLSANDTAGTVVACHGYLRKTGTGLANNDATKVVVAYQSVNTAKNLDAISVVEATVNLDANSDFDWYSSLTLGDTSNTTIVLVGYYK